ncbi:metallophosphoesterase family protein [Sagittula sp. SSi028]|uniref:metallophosphoesterase family protein n=1 Tax=Sagittula sp. SSi028 TaxID=3400636 RepID=UPI003AF63758
MIKLIHTADIHLDSPLKSLALKDEALRERVQAATRTALRRIVDCALSEQVAAVLIAGDLFDGAERSARTAAYLTSELDRLRAADIRVYYIKGNHDAENPITGETALPDNVHVFTGHGGKDELADGLWIHGVSFSNRHAPDSLLPKFSAPVAGAVNIGMLHTSLAGAAGHDVYAPCTLSDLTSSGFDYWALGHVHKRNIHATAPWVVMPGCPQGRDIGEAGPRSATLITIDDGRIDTTEIHTSAVEFTALRVDVSGCPNSDALRDHLRHAVQDHAADLTSDTGIARITLQGQTELHWDILRDRDLWTETLSQLCRSTDRLWLEKTKFDLQPPSQQAEAQATATAELATLMQQIAAEPAMVAAFQSDMQSLLDDLSAARREALMPDDASTQQLVQDLARDGADRVLARMKGADI